VDAPNQGLELCRRLYQKRGRPLLQQLDLLDVCAVGCIGSTSQNARLDDALSRDHCWGPYLYFVLDGAAFKAHSLMLQQAIESMPDEVDGQRWIGYDGPEPRKTAVKEASHLLREQTGLQQPPSGDDEWMRIVQRTGYLGGRWTEQLFHAARGAIFHGDWFRTVWKAWTSFVPPEVKLSLLSRSAFRLWNAGPEYNMERLIRRGDRIGMRLCVARFIDEAMEFGFTLNGQFTPSFKWRGALFERLPAPSDGTKSAIGALAAETDPSAMLSCAASVVSDIKDLLRAEYGVECDTAAPLSMYAQALRRSIRSDSVREQTQLGWYVDLAP
jgi:hypothetical protein